MNVEGEPCFTQLRVKAPSGDLTARSGKPPALWEVNLLSHVWLFATPWTAAYQAPLSIEFSRQEYWSGVAIAFSRGTSRPRDRSRVSHIASRRFTQWATREAHRIHWRVSYLTKAVLEFNSRMSLLCFSGRLDAANTQVSQGEMPTFARQTPNPSAQKDVSLQFQSCVIAFLGQNVLSVNLDFCICFNPDQLNLYNQRTSRQELVKLHVSPRKHNYSTWLAVLKMEGMTHVLFHQLDMASLPRSLGETLLCLKALSSRFKETFPHSFRAVQRNSWNTL